MNPGRSPPLLDADEEVSALIATLHQTGQRLEELTAGEVDSVAHRDGRTFLLQHAQDRLRHSEAAKQAAILNALPAHIALLDTQGLIISVNEAWRQISCADAIQGPGHGIGVNYLELCDSARGDNSAEAHQVAEGIRSVLAGGVKSFSIEYPCHSPTEQRWFLLTVTPLADGHPNGAVVMHLDITERRRTQAALAQSEDGLHRAEVMAKLAHIITGPDGSFERWSETLPRLVGVEPANVPRTTRAWLNILHPDDRSLFRDKALEAGVKKLRVELEYRVQRADGEWIYVRQTMEPLKTVATSGLRWFNTLQDVTVERQAEQKLRESERRFSSMLGNMQLISVMLDREARITYCNEYLLRLTGWRREEVIGQSWVELFIPPETGDLKDRFAALLSDQPEGRHGENKILTRSGERRLIRWNNSVLRSGAGDVIGTASIGEDITEQKRAETRIKRLNRVYAVLSGINTLIVRVRDRDELFREASRIAVEHGKFRMAWIGLVDGETGSVKPVASAGDVRDFFETAPLAITETKTGSHGLAGRAIRDMKPVISNDVHSDPQRLMKRELAERGINSVAVIPLIVRGEAIGVLALYSTDVGLFDEEEMRLLEELAGDISFAIDHIEKEKERKRAEIRIKRLNRVYAVLSGINTLIVRVRDRDELFREACRIAIEAGGFRMTWIGMVDRSVMKLVPVASAGVDEELLTAIKDIYSSGEGAPLGNTMAARAMKEKKAVVSNDLQSNPQAVFGKKHAESGILSMVILPLIVSGEAAGVLGLYSDEIGFFDEEEMKLLTELAGDIAFAVENIAAQQNLEKLSRIRAVSSEINAAIIRIRERNALLEETCRIVAEHGRFEMIWIGALDHDGQQVQPIAWKGFTEETARAVNWASISASKGTLGEAIRTRKASVRNDIDGELPGGKLRGEALKQGCRSSVCLPLAVDDKVVALIVLFAKGVDFFDQRELALLSEVAADVSFALQAIEKQKELEYLSYYDVLTGLANRTLFLERVAQYMRSAVKGGHKLALFLVDLERFKSINDSLGRPAGDALLRQVAEWLTRNLGDANLVARVGADHFAVVLPEVKQEGNVARLVEKTLEAFLEHPFRLNDSVFRIAFKVGVALFPDDGADADTLFKNAEAALKKAKARGDRYLFYKQKMTDTVAGKLTLENQLRQALDKEEFVLHYQPKVSLVSGKLTSAEALIRWNDPLTGLVPPGRFIPILEETGLIHEVGRWALRKAIEDYLRWRTAGLPAVRVSVNVSALQLRHRGFIEEIKEAISIDAHAAAGLELEITESMIMEDVKHNIASLQAIRALGVTIAIDDFGTGFSSLAYLSKLPVDTLKIDRSFVIDMTAGPQGLALVSTIINLAHSLKLKVVAEGVETEEQSRLLRLLNCDEMQGYLFSKPVPVEIFETKFLAPPAATTSTSSSSLATSA